MQCKPQTWRKYVYDISDKEPIPGMYKDAQCNDFLKRQLNLEVFERFK